MINSGDDIVAFANLGFCSNTIECSHRAYLTCYVYVFVKDVNDLSDLYAVVQETNTRIIEQDPYMPRWFTISAGKNSKGNALQMANYFYETGKFAAAQPCFWETKINR